MDRMKSYRNRNEVKLTFRNIQAFLIRHKKKENGMFLGTMCSDFVFTVAFFVIFVISYLFSAACLIFAHFHPFDTDSSHIFF